MRKKKKKTSKKRKKKKKILSDSIQLEDQYEITSIHQRQHYSTSNVVSAVFALKQSKDFAAHI